MIFFTKTCARDWKRCCYQMLAIRRLFPLTRHVVMFEEAELKKIDPRAGAAEENVRILTFSPPSLAPNWRVVVVEEVMPEAMAIEDPELRQQYVKLRAPLIFGEDMIQLDSDMCPKPVQTQWADELYADPTGGSKIRWDMLEPPGQSQKPVLEKWYAAYEWFARGYGTSLPLFPSDGEFFYMGSQYGWYIERKAARRFFKFLGGGALWYAEHGGKTLREPQRVVDRILECVQRGHKFSEYQLFGLYAISNAANVYHFNEIHTPLTKIGEHSWLLHFSSKEQLEPDQEAQLRKAAGLEAQ